MKQPGKRAQLYAIEEVTFGTTPSLSASNAVRHISASFPYNPKNRVFSDEKKAAPGRYARFDRRETADGWSVEALLRPSGTLNTLPECAPFLKAAFGSVSNVTAATTVASSGVVGGATLTSAATLIVKDFVRIVCPDGLLRMRQLTAVNTGTGAVTWAPELPSGQAPANGAAVVSCPTYKLTSALAIALSIARYVPEADFTAGMTECVKGALANTLSLVFDFNGEPRFTVGGPAKTKADAPAQPGGFTQVGTNPPSGASAGEVLIGNTAIKMMNLGFQLTNGLEIRRDEYGTTTGTEGYRMGDRDITAALKMAAENEYKAIVYDLVMAGTNVALFKQTGHTAGKIVAVRAPNCDFGQPDMDVPDGHVGWDFNGVAIETVEDANDELYLALG